MGRNVVYRSEYILRIQIFRDLVSINLYKADEKCNITVLHTNAIAHKSLVFDKGIWNSWTAPSQATNKICCPPHLEKHSF